MKNDNKHKEEQNSLESMLEAATAEDNSEHTIESESKKESKKKIIVSVFAFVVLVGLVIAGSLILSNPQDFEDKTKGPTWVEDGNSNSDSKGEWDFNYPANVPEWSKRKYSYDELIEDDKSTKEIIDWASEIQELMNHVSWVPSEETYTNDVANEYDSNGEYNMQFSYVLKEDYLKAYAIAVQRFINPVFGDWVYSQMHVDGISQKDNPSFETFKDLFTENWWNTNISHLKDYSSLPILADWNGDKFGKDSWTYDTPGIYYGEVINTEDKLASAKSLGLGHRGHNIIEIKTPIKYSAHTSDGKDVKTGELTIVLEPNSYEYSLENRVIVSNVSLKLD